MKRRSFLRTAGATTLAGLAGCAGTGDGGAPGGDDTTTTGTGTDTAAGTGTTTGTAGSADRTLTVGTYGAFLDAPSISAGGWVKQEFERRYDATLKWTAPQGGLSYFIQRKQQGVELEADAYYGLTPTDFARADATLGDAELFTPIDVSQVSNYSNVKEAFRFAPNHRAVPTGASYVCIVYDGRDVEAPGTFEALTRPEYSESLLVPSPQSSQTGKDFLYWTISQYGEDGYLDYWKRLQNNGVRVLGSWSDAYNAFMQSEAPMVVSFSTDQVYAAQSEEEPMAKHQIGFLNDQGYAYVEGAGQFVDSEHDELTRTFLDFVLKPEVQAQIARRNVGLPVVTNASLPEEFGQYVHTPAEPVMFGYDRLKGNVDRWVDEWARQFATQ